MPLSNTTLFFPVAIEVEACLVYRGRMGDVHFCRLKPCERSASRTDLTSISFITQFLYFQCHFMWNASFASFTHASPIGLARILTTEVYFHSGSVCTILSHFSNHLQRFPSAYQALLSLSTNGDVDLIPFKVDENYPKALLEVDGRRQNKLQLCDYNKSSKSKGIYSQIRGHKSNEKRNGTQLLITPLNRSRSTRSTRSHNDKFLHNRT